MHKIRAFLLISTFCLITAGSASAQIKVGRFQLVSVSAGQQAGVFLIDTVNGGTWQLTAKPVTKRLTFVEMDIENLHWSWGSGAQQKLAQKIEGSKLSDEQKRVLKQQLTRTACGWTPVVLTPTPSAP